MTTVDSPPAATVAGATSGRLRALWRRVPQRGLLVALIGLALILPWVRVIHLLNAPDEPAHLQAVMVVRKQHVLPEIHYYFPTATGKVDGNPGDPDTRLF